MAYKNNRTRNRRRYKTRYHSSHNYKAKSSFSQTKVAVLVAVTTFVVISSVVVVFAFGDSIYDWLDGRMQQITATQAQQTVTATQTKDNSTKPPTSAPTKAPTQPPTQAPTQPPQEEQFIKLADQSGFDASNAPGDQIIFVDADSTECKVYCYEKGDNGVYTQALGPYDGYVGSEGVSEYVKPDEQKTPLGVFKIEYAMGSREDPGCGLEYHQFTTESWWVTDPQSQYYNQLVESEDNQDWSSTQWLYEYIYSYPYAIVFNYNRPDADPNQGSAKFLHVSDKPTKGGIGIETEELRSILYWINISKSPCIAISSQNTADTSSESATTVSGTSSTAITASN